MRRYACLMVLAAVFFCPGSLVWGQTATSAKILADAKSLDGRTVTYAGEVIGDVMVRGDHAWINVNDGTNAIGVWITAAMAKEIKAAGYFKHSGDIVEIDGIFNRACVEHGGDLDIHAQALRVISPGAPRMTCSLNKVKKDWVIKLLGVVAIVWILSLLKTR